MQLYGGRVSVMHYQRWPLNQDPGRAPHSLSWGTGWDMLMSRANWQAGSDKATWPEEPADWALRGATQ